MPDIDRIFIATNVELEDQEGNDDRSLCRFEFYEIITRMAKQKYLEKKIAATMPEALERILVEHILPKGKLTMDNTRWRELFLWKLPVDDLLKANLETLQRVYQRLRPLNSKTASLKLLLSYITELPLLRVSPDVVTLAFSFSRMQFVDELEQVETYQQLTFVEFLEFLGRLAWLIWDNPDEFLDVKLWRLLQIFFGPLN